MFPLNNVLKVVFSLQIRIINSIIGRSISIHVILQLKYSTVTPSQQRIISVLGFVKVNCDHTHISIQVDDIASRSCNSVQIKHPFPVKCNSVEVSILLKSNQDIQILLFKYWSARV
jgi:hypothetical protein